MDSNDLERERGITILAKTTGIRYHGVKINIVDTPGHSDFGGEVERALKMVDGVMLLVDASEGPLPQTRYVLIEGARSASCRRSSSSTRSTAPTRASQEVLERDLRPLHRSRRHRRPARFPGALHQSPRPASPRRSLEDEAHRSAPLFEAIVKHIPAARRRSRRRRCRCWSPISTTATISAASRIGRVFNGTLQVRRRRRHRQAATARCTRPRSPSCIRSKG